MKRNIVWLSAPLVQLVRIWVLWAQGHGFEPRKEHIFFLNVLARMAEWSIATSLSLVISGCAGSNPASRKFNIHINNNFRVIINFYSNI